MRKQEQEAWEHFCKTGAVGDYLNYRRSANFSCKQGMDIMTEVENGAAIGGCGGNTGEALGGTGPSADAAHP